MSRRGAAREALWGVGDQALSSVTNFAVAVVVARNVSTAEFGAFTLAFAAYLIILTISRAVTTEPLTIRYSTAGLEGWRSGTTRAVGGAVLFGVGSGAAVTVVGFVVDGSVGRVLVLLGLALPVLLLQDAWRYAFFAARRGSSALVNDLVWAGAFLVLVVLTGGIDDLTASTAILTWAGGAGVASVVGCYQARILPDPRRAGSWYREHRDLTPRLAVEAAVLSGAYPLVLFAVGGVAGLRATGALRAGQVLMNGLHILTYGLQLSAVPEATRTAQRSARSLRRFCVVVALALAAVSLLWAGVLLVLPDSFGRAVLGETWTEARRVILPLGIAATTGGIQAGALIGLRAMALPSYSLVARVTSSATLLVGGLVGGVLNGAQGAAWGLATGSALGSSVWWVQMLRGSRFRTSAVGHDQPGLEMLVDGP